MKPIFDVRVLALAALAAYFSLTIAPCSVAADEPPPVNHDTVVRDMAVGNELVQQFQLAEVMGPLAPVALSPYFGLTLLSGAAILTDRGVLPDNAFLSDNPVLGHETTLMVFLVLTVLTSLPRFTKVSKALAAALDPLETYASIVALGVIYWVARSGGAGDPPAVALAGFPEMTADSLLILAMALNIFVINTVKFFFEMLILLSPVPTLDAVFEVLNKGVAAGLAAVYVFAPTASLILNGLIFLCCLMIFRGVYRRVRFYRALLSGLFFKSSSLSGHFPGADSKSIPQHDAVLHAFLRDKAWGFKKASSVYLVHGEEGWSVVVPRFLRTPAIQPLGAELVMDTGLLSHTLRADGGLRFALSRRYDRLLEAVPGMHDHSEAPAGDPRTVFAAANRSALRASAG